MSDARLNVLLQVAQTWRGSGRAPVGKVWVGGGGGDGEVTVIIGTNDGGAGVKSGFPPTSTGVAYVICGLLMVNKWLTRDGLGEL